MSFPLKVYCQMTGVLLFEQNHEGKVLHLATHGQCSKCYRYYLGKYFPGMPTSIMPTQFKGYICQGCLNIILDNSNV